VRLLAGYGVTLIRMLVTEGSCYHLNEQEVQRLGERGCWLTAVFQQPVALAAAVLLTAVVVMVASLMVAVLMVAWLTAVEPTAVSV